jgi:excisionase family DNA binding protein
LDEYITIDQAAKECGVTRAAVYRWHKIGRITLYKKGLRTVVTRSDIDKIKAESESIRPLDR